MSSTAEAPRTLESRLGRLLAVMLLAILLLLLAIAAWIGREAAIQFALSRLHHDAEAILTRLDVDRRRLIGNLQPIYHQPLSGHYFVIRFEDGARLRSRSLWDHEMALPPASPEAPRYWLADGPRGQRLLVWERRYRKDGAAFDIAIAEDVAPLLSAIWRFVGIGLVASVGAVLLLWVLQRWMLRRAFAPFDRIRAEVREVRKGGRESVSTDVPAEVLPVVNEFNQLLAAWRQHQARSRNALGNLAHALKTPLQLILRRGEALGDETVQLQSRRMQQLVERELKRARITGRGGAGRVFRPREDIEALVETLKTLYHHKALRWRVAVETPDALRLDQSDMLELAGNLLDNAAKWAQGQVSLRLEADEAALRLVVEDDGPGVDGETLEACLGRGGRLDENRPGHGLGLAIVRDIVTLYDGTIRFNRAPALGGLRVAVVLPLT